MPAPSPALGSCGRCTWRSIIPGMTTHGRRSVAAAASSGRAEAGPANVIRPSASVSTRPSGSWRTPPPASGERSRARIAKGGPAGIVEVAFTDLG